MWKPRNSVPNRTHRRKFRKEFLPNRKMAADTPKNLFLAKCIIQHLRQWVEYTHHPLFLNRPLNANYELDLMLWANRRILHAIKKNHDRYFSSTLTPKPFEEYEIAALYVAMRVHGEPEGNVRPLLCVNERYVVVINLSQV